LEYTLLGPKGVEVEGQSESPITKKKQEIELYN